MTVILVTHDREEALSMSDRIALMFSGRLVQTGTPKEVYLRPESRLAADYFGDCVYINGTISWGRFTGGGLDCPVPFLSQEFISQAIPFPADAPVPGPSVPDGPCRLMLRPGSLEPDRTGGYFLTVEQVSFRGGSVLVSLRSDDGDLWKKAFSGPVDLAPGDRIQASVRTQDGVLFPV
jgi:ABC-type spermidine/putrescine transport systems, ATPase components